MTDHEQKQIDKLFDKMDEMSGEFSAVGKLVAKIEERTQHLPTKTYVDQKVESAIMRNRDDTMRDMKLFCAEQHGRGDSNDKRKFKMPIPTKKDGIWGAVASALTVAAWLISGCM
jgi:hypothetical protein